MAKPKKHQNRELMKRISLTISKRLLSDVDNHVKVFAEGDLNENRSKYICSVLEARTPTTD